MNTEAKIILDSIGPANVRLTTFQIRFPRFILPEFNTHRMISKNASSSRAIPVQKQIDMVRNHPFVPKAFNANAPGMQGGAVISAEEQALAEKEWLMARDKATDSAEALLKMGLAKQYVNRLIEPFTWSTVVCTGTDWDNFFALRIHPAAQPEIHELAKAMYAARAVSSPQVLEAGQWHLPFIGADKFETTQEAIRSSVARCARVSYLNHEGKKPTREEDDALYNRLLGSAPIHASPAEHQARAVGPEWEFYRSGNFRGWVQYRKTLENENIEKYVP